MSYKLRIFECAECEYSTKEFGKALTCNWEGMLPEECSKIKECGCWTAEASKEEVDDNN